MDTTEFKMYITGMIGDVIEFHGCYGDLLGVCIEMWTRLSPSDKEAIAEKLKNLPS
jgi:hypothetical protein